MSEITSVLHALAQGQAGAADELLSLIYAELRRLAAAKMARELARTDYFKPPPWSMRLGCGWAVGCSRIALTSSVRPLRPCAES